VAKNLVAERDRHLGDIDNTANTTCNERSSNGILFEVRAGIWSKSTDVESKDNEWRGNQPTDHGKGVLIVVSAGDRTRKGNIRIDAKDVIFKRSQAASNFKVVGMTLPTDTHLKTHDKGEEDWNGLIPRVKVNLRLLLDLLARNRRDAHRPVIIPIALSNECFFESHDD
jgi:hypothetical protein